MHEIYFREVTEYLKGKFKDEGEDIITETFLPVTLEEYRDNDFTLEIYTEQLKEYLDKGDEEYMLVSLSNGGNALLDAALDCNNDRNNVKAAVFCDFVGDWEYQDPIFKLASNALGWIPEHSRNFFGGNKYAIKGMLMPMLDHNRIESKKKDEIYKEVVNVTKAHGGKGLIKALEDLKEHTSDENNIEKIRALVKKENMDVYSIEASKSTDTEKYFNAINHPEICRMTIKSRHLIPLQEPKKLGDVLSHIYRDTIQHCDSKEPKEPFPQKPQELLQISSL